MRKALPSCRAIIGLVPVLLGATLLAPARAAEPIRVDLNALEPAQGRCRMTFVTENKGDALTSLRLDLAVFGKDGAIHRRLVVELGPLRAGKTLVRAFEIDASCENVGSVLVNDVAACTIHKEHTGCSAVGMKPPQPAWPRSVI